MIKRPTVLVLGAGASVPYGYPSGRRLLRIISEILLFQKTSKDREYLKALGIPDDKVEAFAGELALSESPSVDAFLESRPEYLDIGKLEMAINLVRCENIEKLFSIHRSEDDPGWYFYLFNKMVGPKLRDFANNDLSIISFNYDRSLEFQWYRALIYRFGRQYETEIKDMLAQMRVVHVHGTLGKLPWEKDACREYDRDFTIDEIKTLSDQIIVMSELQETSKEFDKARHFLRAGTFVYFLGFGYHQMNLSRLGVKEFSNKRPLWGSSVGLEQGEIDQINESWGIQCPVPNLGILDLIRRYHPIDLDLKY